MIWALGHMSNYCCIVPVQIHAQIVDFATKRQGRGPLTIIKTKSNHQEETEFLTIFQGTRKALVQELLCIYGNWTAVWNVALGRGENFKDDSVQQLHMETFPEKHTDIEGYFGIRNFDQDLSQMLLYTLCYLYDLQQAQDEKCTSYALSLERLLKSRHTAVTTSMRWPQKPTSKYPMYFNFNLLGFAQHTKPNEQAFHAWLQKSISTEDFYTFMQERYNIKFSSIKFAYDDLTISIYLSSLTSKDCREVGNCLRRAIWSLYEKFLDEINVESGIGQEDSGSGEKFAS